MFEYKDVRIYHMQTAWMNNRLQQQPPVSGRSASRPVWYGGFDISHVGDDFTGQMAQPTVSQH